jgi:hypothetical protein
LILINVPSCGRNKTEANGRKTMILVPILLAASAAVATENSAMSRPSALLPDIPTKVGNVEAVCTGIGLDSRQNPAWLAYPLKVEFVGRGGQYLGDVHMALSQRKKVLAQISCGGPWVLFQAPAGRYEIEANTEGKLVSSPAVVSANGQSRIILRFPDLGGEIEHPVQSAVTPVSQ